MKANIECTVKQCNTCLQYQWTQPEEKALNYEILCRAWEVIGVDIFMINGKHLLFIVDHHSKFPIVNNQSSDSLVQMTKLIFAEYRLPKKIVSDADKNFMAGTFKAFCRKMNIQQTITLSLLAPKQWPGGIMYKNHKVYY